MAKPDERMPRSVIRSPESIGRGPIGLSLGAQKHGSLTLRSNLHHGF